MPRVCGHDGHYGNGVYKSDMDRLEELTGGALYVFDGNDGKNVVYRKGDRVLCDRGADPGALTTAQMRADAFRRPDSYVGDSGLKEPLLRW